MARNPSPRFVSIPVPVLILSAVMAVVPGLACSQSVPVLQRKGCRKPTVPEATHQDSSTRPHPHAGQASGEL